MPNTPSPASQKQVDFIASLAAERNMTVATGDLSKAEASKWITTLLAMPKAPKPVTDVNAEIVEAGKIYTNAAGDVVKVTASKVGNLYGKVRVGNTWDYRPGVLIGLRPITADEAAAYGAMFERCVFCSTALSDDGEGRSVEVGYGPICAARYALPWGTPEASAKASGGAVVASDPTDETNLLDGEVQQALWPVSA